MQLKRVSSSKLALASVLAFAACQNQKPAPTQNGGGQTTASTRLPTSHVVARYKGGQLTYGELLEMRKSSFRTLRNKQKSEMFQAEQRELQRYISEMLVKQEAKNQGLTEKQYLEKVTASAAVSEEEMKAFYDQNAAQIGQPYEMAKPRIQQHLTQQKQGQAAAAAVQGLMAAANLQLDLPPPEMEKVEFDLAGRPTKGNPNAKLTLVEFSDFECPYCSRAVPAVEGLLKAFPNDLKIVFLHFPLSFHRQAMPSAIASKCANDQGKFWEYHDQLFNNQTSLNPGTYDKIGVELGLDMDKFRACQKDPASKAFVEADMEQAQNAGVQGTPSFFINGTPTQGVPSPDVLRPYLSAASAQAPTP